MPSPITYWVLLLSVCAAAPCGSPSGSRAHALELATEVNEAVVMPDRPSCVPRSDSDARHPQKPMRCWRRSSNGMESPSPVTSEETNLGIANAGCRMAAIGNMTSIGKHPADRAARNASSSSSAAGKAYYTDDHYRTFIPLN